MTTIKLNGTSLLNCDLENGIANGRPVAFSQAAWGWYFTDTNGDAAAEFVRGQIYFQFSN